MGLRSPNEFHTCDFVSSRVVKLDRLMILALLGFCKHECWGLCCRFHTIPAISPQDFAEYEAIKTSKAQMMAGVPTGLRRRSFFGKQSEFDQKESTFSQRHQ